MAYVDVGLSTRVKAGVDPANPPQMPSDGYPAIYQDQRTMLAGGLDCETAEDIFWNVWVPHLERFQQKAPTLDPHEVIPYLSAGRWVADCPCGGGMACWDRNPYACCLGCGRMCKVAWQPPTVRAEVMRLLAGRPEGNRNWEVGETVEELKIQNVLLQGVPSVEREGLLVAENVTIPDDFTTVGDYLEQLRSERRP